MSDASTAPHRRILASAGTGKTYQLTSRYLQLVLDGADPRGILATTFTRAAAAEIRTRILGTAAQAVLEEGKRRELAERTGRQSLESAEVAGLLERLVSGLQTLQIKTIDSTFAGIAGAAAPELGLPDGLGILETDEQAGLAHQALGGALAAAAEEDRSEAFLGALEALGRGGGAGRSLVQLLDSIIEKGLMTYHDAGGDPGPWRWSVPPLGDLPELTELERRLRDHAVAREDEVGRADRIVKEVVRFADALAAFHEDHGDSEPGLESWKTLLTRGIPSKVLQGETTFYGLEIEDALQSLVRPLVDRLHEVAFADYARRTSSSYYLLHLYDETRETIRNRLGVATFADVVRLLRATQDALLRQDLWYRLDAGVRHLMLDEFQDTSLAQWKVLQPLAEEIVADGTGERSLFCVGDVKQSIYGWRGGLPGILEHLDRMIRPDGRPVGLEDTRLSRSYRSAPEVLEAVNRVFGGLDANPVLAGDARPAAKSITDLWEPHEAARTDLPGFVELRAVEAESGKVKAINRATAAAAAELAATLHARHPGRSIGVLAPRNDAVGSVVAALRDAGVEATGEGGGSFLDCGATVVMLDALLLAGRPGSGPAAFNVLHSPLAPIVGLDALEAAPRVARALREAFATDGIAGTLESWEAALAGHLDRRETARVQRLVVELERLEAGGEHDPVRLARLLERIRLDEPGSDAVRVMTIHKSKGLEFDLVVLAGLESPLFSTPDLAWERPLPPGDISRVFRWTNEEVRPPQVEPLHATARLEATRERLCQLYVAMTRARHGLFMLVGPRPPKKERVSMAGVLRAALDGVGLEGMPAADGVLGRIGSSDCLPAIEPPRTEGAVDRPVARGVRIEPAVDSSLAAAPAPSSHGSEPGGASPFTPAAREAADIGTAWHLLLEQVEWIETWTAEETALVELLREELPRTTPEWCAEQVRGLREALGHSSVRKALSNGIFGPEGAVEVERECRWIAPVPGGGTREGVIDRLVVGRDEDGPRALIIDWKTDRVPDGGHLEHAERYRTQLASYRAAAAELLELDPERIGARLVFLRDGTEVDLEPESPIERPGD